MMRLLILLLLLSLRLSCVGQDSLSQFDQYGFKTGKWVTYTAFNKPEKITFYSTRLEVKSRELLFFEGQLFEKDCVVDTVQEILWFEKYYYDSLQNQHKVAYFEKGILLKTYYGTNKQVSASILDSICYTQRQYPQKITIPVSNNIWEPIPLHVQIKHGDKVFNQFAYSALPQSVNFISITVPFIQGKSLMTILVTGQHGIAFKFNITTYGFDLSSRNLDHTDTLYADSTLIFLRESETLCQAYSSNKKRLLKSFPLHHDLTTIDLGEIDKKAFWLKFISYTTQKSEWVYIKMNQ